MSDCARKFVLWDARNQECMVLNGPTSMEEMHKFLGAMLQMSLSPRDSGGHPAYFQKQNRKTLDIKIPDSVGSAAKCVSLV